MVCVLIVIILTSNAVVRAENVADGVCQCKNSCPETTPPVSTAMAPITAHASITAQPTSTRNVRLPPNVYPTIYEVELQPHMYNGDPDDFYFNGSVKIEVQCKKSTNEIVLHSNKLNISTRSVFIYSLGLSGEPMKPNVSFDTTNQFLILQTSQEFQAGSYYSIQMTFRGALNNDLKGLYLSSYSQGDDRIYLTTSQMQPTDARKAFPCFDEPAIKAKFKVTLVRKKHMISLSNTPIKSSKDRGNNWIADHYQTTPKMSTYLLAFIVCDFKYTSKVTPSKIMFKAWARPEAVEQTHYSLGVGVDILTFFESYFNISFPLGKSDMIAVPNFPAGAMENWGLITYRESAMLFDPKESSETNRQRVAEVVSHELAHQWFGNLVTPSWWDDLWLNEGFASFIQYMGVDHVHPDWLMFEQFAVSSLQDVFNFDGLVTSHPVYVPVQHPDEINEIFDRVSYGKGASIIRMMRFFLGEDTFQKGLGRYLRTKSYDAAFHNDLWDALQKQSKEDGKVINVKNIMDTWTLQMNFPVVTMKRDGDNLLLEQSRYLLDYNATDPGTYKSKFSYKWDIPFTFTSSIDPQFKQTEDNIIWMEKGELEVILVGALSKIPVNGWYIGNVMQYGFYRVNYPEDNWKQLIKQLKTNHTHCIGRKVILQRQNITQNTSLWLVRTAIHPINRAQIINDAWNLAKSGDLKMDIALQTVEYLSNETHYVPFSAASRELEYLNSMLERTELYGAFKMFMKTTFTKPFVKLGMNNTGASHLDTYVRRIVVDQACQYENTECIWNAKEYFKQYMDNSGADNPVDVNLRHTVYCTAIRYGGIAEWDFAYQKYKTSNVASEKGVLLFALSCSREVWILSRYLTYTLISDEILSVDAVTSMVHIAKNPIGRALTWPFVIDNWKFIFNKYGAAFFSFSRLISGITSSFNTAFELKMIEYFGKENESLGTGLRAYQQSKEKTQNNIRWLETNFDTIKTWLKSQTLKLKTK